MARYEVDKSGTGTAAVMVNHPRRRASSGSSIRILGLMIEKLRHPFIRVREDSYIPLLQFISIIQKN